ncbi:MAG TPA: DUF4230 domain-containing protein [Pseudonocardia sp.]|jgi:hypothetical protein|uniref:DUF4230 domain-containing protein n=1 Tax=Pseudonocardia sp. TaxID=60912 RepID=UPI002B4B17CA|nr:DUF4230 domain-containing protein [Pseudonocardia sp.]HLU60098.1 DUF4230 domain-containing protein [Pseudonocardia sp.]
MAQHPFGPDSRAWLGRLRRRPRVALFAAIAAVAIALPLGAQVGGLFPALSDTFTPRTVDRGPAPLMAALSDISEYHAATGSFQVLVDIEHDTPHVPAVISGERTTLFATGRVDALVDLSGLGPDRVRTTADDSAVSFTLPRARLSSATLDPAATRVVGRERGIVERVAGVLAGNPVDDEDLYQLAARRIEETARASDLTARAEANTRDMLTTLARSLGYEQVTVTFEDPR